MKKKLNELKQRFEELKAQEDYVGLKELYHETNIVSLGALSIYSIDKDLEKLRKTNEEFEMLKDAISDIAIVY